MDKAALRQQMILLRKNFAAKKTASAAITKKIMQLTVWKKAKSVCIYTSLPNEVDTGVLLQSGKEISWESLDLYIVPGVAFDIHGNRLGRGRGFYDKLLAHVTVPKIGLAYSIQVLAEVPHSSYDVPMDMVVTEKGMYENKTS